MEIFNIADLVNYYRELQGSFCGLLNKITVFLINWVCLINWTKLWGV